MIKCRTDLTIPCVFILISLAWASIKLSLPALPVLVTVFHTDALHLKLSVTLMIASLALSQLFWGAISDSIGRKSVALIAIGIAAYGTYLVITSHNIVLFILGRCVEGVGVGGFSPVGKAIFTDSFDRKKLVSLLALFSAVACLMPFVAPVLGGFLLVGVGWRAIFIFYLVCLLLIFLLVGFFLKETHVHQASDKPIRHALKAYGAIMCVPRFWGFVLCYMLLTGTLIGYYTAMPFWFVTEWHIPEQYYAFLAIASVACNLLGLGLSRRLIRQCSIEKVIWFSLWGVLLLAMVVTVAAYLFHLSAILRLIALPVIYSLYAFFVGIVYPCANAGAASSALAYPGMVGALSSTCMFLTGSLMTWIESQFNVTTFHSVALLLCVNALIMLIGFYGFVYRTADRSD